MSIYRSHIPTEQKYHMGKSAHTPLGLGWRLGCSTSPVWFGGWGGSGVSVRARGLCDISRLPIWLGEWTPSNYSCSYCLINLPVSLLHATLPTPPHTIFFHSLLQRSRGKRKKKYWVAGHHKTQQRFLKSQRDNPAKLYSNINGLRISLSEKFALT